MHGLRLTANSLPSPAFSEARVAAVKRPDLVDYLEDEFAQLMETETLRYFGG